MQMQTGPARDQSMRGWLVWTGVLEWANVVGFGVVFWRFGEGSSGVGRFAVLGLATLEVVLFEGGAYWLVKRRAGGLRGSAARRLRLFRALYAGNVFLLLVFPVALLAAVVSGRGPGGTDALLGAALYLLGLGEFVHYFVWKINMRPAEFRRAWRARRPVPARLWREYRRARRAVVASPVSP